MVVGHVTGPCCLLFHHTPQVLEFVGFVLQSTAFCSAVGKVRNESPPERPDVDTDKLCLSLSICLNGSDAPAGSARRCAALARRQRRKEGREVGGFQVEPVNFTQCKI